MSFHIQLILNVNSIVKQTLSCSNLFKVNIFLFLNSNYEQQRAETVDSNTGAAIKNDIRRDGRIRDRSENERRQDEDQDISGLFGERSGRAGRR